MTKIFENNDHSILELSFCGLFVKMALRKRISLCEPDVSTKIRNF